MGLTYEGTLTKIGQDINFVPLAMSQSPAEAPCAWNSLCQALLHDTPDMGMMPFLTNVPWEVCKRLSPGPP